MNSKYGKKLYRSSAKNFIKFFLFFIVFILFLNLCLSTFYDQRFINLDEKISILDFHLMYPENLILFIFSIVLPAIYYAFIRAIIFYERGLVINKGLPFFNRFIDYNKIKSYKLVHPKGLMSIARKDIDGEEMLFTVRDPDRAVAIFDQQGILGDFSKAELDNTVSAHKKFLITVLLFSLVIYLIQTFGVMSFILGS